MNRTNSRCVGRLRSRSINYSRSTTLSTYFAQCKIELIWDLCELFSIDNFAKTAFLINIIYWFTFSIVPFENQLEWRFTTILQILNIFLSSLWPWRLLRCSRVLRQCTRLSHIFNFSSGGWVRICNWSRNSSRGRNRLGLISKCFSSCLICKFFSSCLISKCFSSCLGVYCLLCLFCLKLQFCYLRIDCFLCSRNPFCRICIKSCL